MNVTPFEQFLEAYKTAPIVPVSTELLGDLDTPVSTFLKATSGHYRFLFESVEDNARRGRYSIIGDSPVAILKSKNGHSVLSDCQTGESADFEDDPFQALRNVLHQYLHPMETKVPFLNGGLFGFLGYDSIRYIERLPELSADDTGLPDIHLFIPKKIIVFDNLLNKINIIQFVTPRGDAEAQYHQAVASLSEITRKIQSSNLVNEESAPCSQNEVSFESNMQQSRFENMVLKAKQHIQRGDAFQIVLSQRLTVKTQTRPFEIYRALRVINPSPYMFYMDMDDVHILGSSPETLVKLKDDKVYVKPIAGTRKRGVNEEEDNLLIEDLLADPKERAEHTMLVDLGRNDVGRIAEFGTVSVDDLMITEKYSHVIHIVSTVSGTLRRGMDSVDVFKACFPAGTVSGAPKVRAMEIIEELEPTRRGIYAGAVGYFSFDGSMDVCIAIRTIYMKANTAFLQAGAGIVADSVPELEYEETLNKARGLLKAIEYAEGGLG